MIIIIIIIMHSYYLYSCELPTHATPKRDSGGDEV